MSTSGSGAVISFLVVGDKKYSAKIDTIGAALIDEGIYGATELGNRLRSNRGYSTAIPERIDHY